MRPRVPVAALAFLAGLVPVASQAAAPAEEAFVVVVGHNGAGAGLPRLHYADDDAVRMALFFSGLHGAGRVWLLADPDADTRTTLHSAGIELPRHRPPTRTALFAVLEEVRAAASRRAPPRGAVLYFIYAGHGLEGRFLLQPESGPEAAMTGTELRSVLASLPVDRLLLFFDACRSQSLFTARGPDAEIGPDLMSDVSALEARARSLPIGVLTAAASAHPAGESQAIRAGYFSHVLGSGLAGAADADGDQVLSFGELAAFVAFNTERLTGQRPWFAPPSGDLGATVLDLRGRSPRLELSKQGAGRYLVGAGPGLPIFAEAFKAFARPVRLFLPPGRYRITHVEPDQQSAAESTEVLLGPGTSATVTDQGWSAAPFPRPPARGRGEQAPIDGLEVTGFTAPFTPAVVSALSSGYQAGREPPAALGSERPLLAALATVAASPLELGGADAGGGLQLVQPAGGVLLAVAAELSTSFHRADGADYRLVRTQLGLRAGLPWPRWRRLTLLPFLELGWQTVIRSAADRRSGDLFVPAVAAGLSALIPLPGALRLVLDGRYQTSWIDVDGRARRSRAPAAGLGLGWAL